MINRDGLKIHNNAKAVFEELMRGTGCVIGTNCSMFLENSSQDEKTIVVSQVPADSKPSAKEIFASNQFKGAWELYQRWSNA
jgi:hypothetical protein